MEGDNEGAAMAAGGMTVGDHNHGNHGALASTGYVDITEFGVFHGTSSHTHGDSLEGGRTPITTEAFISYNGLRAFLGLDPLDLGAVGEWAYANGMTNNPTPYGETQKGVGLYYGMQAAKVGWIRDDAFDPQLLADIQREARLGTPENVMQMVEEVGLDGYAAYLEASGLVDTFVNTLKMEPHYGGWMHGVVHGGLQLDGAVSHDVNHLTVLSHDQTRPFMNDTFDYPQWSALDVPEADVANYFQSMVLLSDPLGDGIATGTTGVDNPTPVDPAPVDPMPDMDGDHDHGDMGGDPMPVDPAPVDPMPDMGGGQTYSVGTVSVVTDFDPATDKLDVGGDSIHNQIGVDTADGFMMMHMHNSSKSLLLEGVYLKDLTASNFAPIADGHLQQDMSAALAYENGTGLVRENTIYVRSHEANLVEVVDFDPATDKVSMFYLSVRGDQGLNFEVEQTDAGVRFFSAITGQSLTLRDTTFNDLNSDHFEWRANQLEDNVAGRMFLADQIDGFTYENIYSGKSVPMAGLVDRAPYHSQTDYTGTPIGGGTVTPDPVDPTPVDPDPVDPDPTPVDPDPVDPDPTPVDPDPVDPTPDTGGSNGGVTFDASNQWATGFVAQGTLTPTATTNGWTISFRSSAEITNIWNAEIVSHEGDVYTIKNASYNGSLSAGQEVSFGFQAEGADNTISDIMVNGEAIDGGGTVDPVDPDPVDPDPVDPVDPDPVDPVDVIPNVSVADIMADEGDPGTITVGGGGTGSGVIAKGALSTSGNQIIDSAGNAVEIRAVNWFGAETSFQAPHGLWQENWQTMLDKMIENGFNALRLPFSSDMVLNNPVPSGINGSTNADLVGLTSLEIFDKIIDHADDIGLRVLLDHHRNVEGNSATDNGLWYGEGGYTEADWINTWEIMAERYGDSPAVIGADLHNEPHGPATWGDGGPTDWARAAGEAGNAVLNIAPDWLIVVEGIESYQGESYWWGGNLQGVADHPVELAVDDKLVYSPHDYPASVFAQDWFFDGSDLSEVFRDAWGYIFEDGIAPVLVGEFGSKLETDVDRAWAEAIVKYMNGDFNLDGASDLAAGQSGISFAWWSWNPNSGDTGGILNDDWQTVRQEAIELLEPLLANDTDGGVAPVDIPAPNPTTSFTLTLDEASDAPVTLNYRTEDGTATAGEDYEAASGSVTFAAGETSKTVEITLLADDVAEPDETFNIIVEGGANGTVTATATIKDDDGYVAPVDPDPVDPDPVDPDPIDPDMGNDTPIGVTVTGGSVTESDPGVDHMHMDGTSHMHDDGHRYIIFEVALDAPATDTVTLTYATSDGTAVADTTNTMAWDYHETTGTLVFAPGEQTKTVSVAVHPDSTIEGTETFTFQVSGENITGDLVATGIIYDNDVADPTPVDPMPDMGGGQTYAVGTIDVVTDFDPAKDKLDLGGDSIHNQIGVDTADGFAMLHMFDSSKSLLLEGVYLKDLTAGNFTPIADAHLQQDLSASLAYENGTGLVRENTIYVRSHEAGLNEIVDFDPATDTVSMFYLSVRGDQGRNFVAEQTDAGVRFYSPVTGQSLTLRDTTFDDLNSGHFEWRANQIEDNVAGRMFLADQIDGFSYENIYSGKSVAMAGLVDRAPYHSQPEYTGTPIGTPADGGGNTPDPVDPTPVDPDPVDPDPTPVDPDPTPIDPDPIDPTPPVTPGDGTGSYDSGNGSPFQASDYAEVLDRSMNFYYAQYAGDLADDHPISWRNDSTLDDGADVGRDLSGGMFDAGDHVKFGLPMAYTATTLAWGGIAFKEGYKASNGYEDLGNHLKQLNDYFLQAYDDKGTADLSDDVFHAQVGDGNLDHAFWGAPEDMTMDRPTFSVDAANPGSDVTGETAAAMAASSIFYREKGDTAYADELLEKAIQLFNFAETYQGKYSDAIQNVVSFYNSWSGFEDELAWASNWLYQATGDESYLAKSEQYYSAADAGWAFAWDDKGHGTAVLLAEQTGKAKYINDVNAHLDHHINEIHTLAGTDTNNGLAWVDQWGSNRYAANTSFIAQLQAKNEAAAGNNARADELKQFATDQLDYIMGDNPEGFSYVVGFGDEYSEQPHHRAASGTTYAQQPGDNKYDIDGALVGGPNREGNYNDDRNDYFSNEVATDYNAGFSGALAAAVQGLVAPDAGPVAPPADDPNAGQPDPTPSDPDPVTPIPTDPMPDNGGADGVLSAYLDVKDDWGSGAVVELTVTNNTGQAISDWDVDFDLSVGIANGWNAEITEVSDGRFSAEDAGWNGTVNNGASVTIGFQTTGGGLDEDQINALADFTFELM